MVVTHQLVTPAEIERLQKMHHELYDLPSPWAQHLEGSYFDRAYVRHKPDLRKPVPFLDNTARDFEWSLHDDEWVVRWVTREAGIALAGPPPERFIAPVPADVLVAEVKETMREWGAEILDGRYSMGSIWAQSFIVICYCRMMQTVAEGKIASKPAGVRWAHENLLPQWSALAQRAWENRPDPNTKARTAADEHECALTRRLVEFVLEDAS